MKAYLGTQGGRDISHSQAGRSLEQGSGANIIAIRCQNSYLLTPRCSRFTALEHLHVFTVAVCVPAVLAKLVVVAASTVDLIVAYTVGGVNEVVASSAKDLVAPACRGLKVVGYVATDDRVVALAVIVHAVYEVVTPIEGASLALVLHLRPQPGVQVDGQVVADGVETHEVPGVEVVVEDPGVDYGLLAPVLPEDVVIEATPALEHIPAAATNYVVDARAA